MLNQRFRDAVNSPIRSILYPTSIMPPKILSLTGKDTVAT